MTSNHRIVAATALAASLATAPAGAADRTIGITGEYVDFTGGFGSRRVARADYDIDLGATRLVFDLSHGRRKAGGERFSGSRLQASVAHDWTGRLTSTTTLGVGSNDPLFPRLEAEQKLSLKLGGGLVATAGARHARYFGGVSVNALSGAASWYFRGGSITYRLTRADVEDRGTGTAHLVSGRIDDRSGGGHTQAWLGSGSTAHALDLLPELPDGRVRSVALRRVQPIAGPVALSLGAGHSWYRLPTDRYRGRSVSLGLVLTR